MNDKNLLLVFLGIMAISFAFLAGCAQTAPESTGISAKQIAGGIEVSWNPSQKADVTGYNLYRSTAQGDMGAKINPVLLTATSYTDANVEHGLTYYYNVRSVSSGGAEDTNALQASATASTHPPSGLSIKINGGEQYTNSRSVTLTLSAQGAARCRVSNDQTSWSSWEPYSASMSWQLSEGNGHKDVYYQCMDSAGNTAVPASAAIYLDTEGPSISISSPDAGGSYGSPFQLSFTVSDPISSTVTCTGSVDGAAIVIGRIDTGKEDSMSINANPGTHALSITCDDGVNTATESVSFSVADRPSVELHIQSGAGYVDSTYVTLDVIAKNAASCRYSNEDMRWSGWTTYTGQAQWTLSPGDGLKKVYAECRDSREQVSATASDTVYLDTRKGPRISIEIDNGDGWTNTRDVKLGLYAYSAYQCRYRNEHGDWSAWSAYDTRKSWTLSSGEGDKTVYYNCKDSRGDDLGTASADIYYSSREPDPPSSMSIKINDGASHTSTAYVHLKLHASNADACRLSNDGGSWSSYSRYTTSMDWTLASGGGKKTVYYQCKNDYGKSTAQSSIYLDDSPPGPPVNLKATVDSRGTVHLSWSRPSSGGVYEYNIYRSNTAFGMFEKAGSTRSTTYADSGLAGGYTYAYTVKAEDSAGNEGPDSNFATITVPGGTDVGGDTDEHGCKSSAGYVWCEPLQECIKPWETDCPE